MKKNRRFSSLLNLALTVVAYIVIKLVLGAMGGNRAVTNLLTQVCYNIIMVASLNLVAGVLGELTLGHAGFMAVGAYGSAIFTSLILPNQPWTFPMALIVGGLAAALFAYLVGVPALRLQGDYLAIITLGFGEIIRVLINTVFAPWTGGGKKMFGIGLYTNFDNAFWIMFLTVAIFYMLAWSRHGRAILAIRENAVAADTAGVPVTKYKTITFVIAGFFAGIAGGLYAHSVGVLDPTKFDYNTSINFLVMAVFGGLGSYTGSIAAAALLTVVQFLMSSLVEYRQLAYALLLIVMMIFKPSGLLGVKEFSSERLLEKIIPGWKGFADKMEKKLQRRKMRAIAPDIPEYDYDSEKYPVLAMKNLGIRFGGLHAAEDVNLSIYEHEIVGLIGPNGAGKTTIFNLLTNVYQPTRGTILLRGVDTKGMTTAQVNRMGIARTFQNIRLFSSMSVLDNVKVGMHNGIKCSFASSLLHTPRYYRSERIAKERCMELLDFMGMADLAQQRAGSLPYGAQRRLEIVRALATNPAIILLDEPAAGMNPSETAELMEHIRLIRDTFQIAIMLIEHDMNLVMGVCEGIAVVNYGKIIAKGTPDQIRSNPEVIEAYLGKKGAERHAEG